MGTDGSSFEKCSLYRVLVLSVFDCVPENKQEIHCYKHLVKNEFCLFGNLVGKKKWSKIDIMSSIESTTCYNISWLFGGGAGYGFGFV